MTAGTFMVARSIWDHAAFAPGEFSEREAFLWLISEAAWKPRTTRVAGHVVDLERGQLSASVRFLAEAWGWSKSRVGRFLDRLRDRGMIEKRDSSGTAPLVITLCNYDRFQGERDSDETKAGQQRDSSGTNENKGIREKEREDIPPTPLKPRGADDPAFSEFWAAYPRKIAKGAARKAWTKAIRTADPPTIIAAAARLEDRGQFTPHPASWLNAERWLDEDHAHERACTPQQPRRGSSLFDAAARLGERFAASRGDCGSPEDDDPGGSGPHRASGGAAVVSLLAAGRAYG